MTQQDGNAEMNYLHICPFSPLSSGFADGKQEDCLRCESLREMVKKVVKEKGGTSTTT